MPIAPPFNLELFAPCVEICHRGKCHVGDACNEDLVSIEHHAHAGYCPIGKFAAHQRARPDGWEELQKQTTGIPFTPRTPPAEIIPLLTSDHPHADKWSRWANVKEAYKLAVRAACEQIPEYPGGHGRGIVIVAGGKYFAQGMITIQIVRELGIDLPIEMWHLPGEITEGKRRYAESFGIKLCEGAARGGWELKLYAMAHSGYEEILFLDSDSYPARKVDDFWECEGYKETGLVMFPERPAHHLEPVYHPGDRLKTEVFEAFDVPFVDERSKESGEMFVNRRRVWKALWLANWIAERSAYAFRWIFGDKDVLFLAARKLEIPYYVMPYFWDHQDPAIIHFDWRDQICFIHRCHGKADPYQVGFSNTPQRQQRNDRLPHEELYWKLFDQVGKDLAEDIREHRRLHPRITAVTVCIGYAKYLSGTLHANRKLFDDLIVVTEAADEETRALCEKLGLRVVLSERKNANGASFNLGALRNDGLSVAEGDWTCLIDADVILPDDLRKKLPKLDESKIYGIGRKGHSEEWNDTPLSGFFQLFHSSQQKRYREDFPDAGFSDTAFRDLWPASDRVMIEGLTARHLGTTAVDWKGVKVKKFDGAAVWAELEALPFLPDLSIVPQRVQEIVKNLPRFSCTCRRDATNYLATNPIDISSPLSLAKYIWRWRNWVNRKLRKPEMPWATAATRTGWEKLELTANA